jgi:glycosyltransferase involved in cell wall biosynthesis
MKILFIADKLQYFFKDIFQELTKNHEITFFKLNKFPNLVKLFVEARKCDIIFVEYLAGAARILSMFKPIIRKPIVVRCHRFELYERLEKPSKVEATRKTAEKVDEIICVSKGIRKRLISFFPQAEKKSTVINNGVPVQKMAPITQDKKVEIGSMGFLTERKGFLGLIEAVSDLINEGNDVVLHIAGKGDQMETLKERVRQLGKYSSIFIDGFISDEEYAGWYETKDVYVQNSSSEGHCTTMITAMSFGLPVFSSDVYGAKDSLEQEFIYPVGDQEELKNKLRWFLKLPKGEILEIRKANYQKAQNDFNITKQSEKIINVLRTHLQ